MRQEETEINEKINDMAWKWIYEYKAIIFLSGSCDGAFTCDPIANKQLLSERTMVLAHLYRRSFERLLRSS